MSSLRLLTRQLRKNPRDIRWFRSQADQYYEELHAGLQKTRPGARDEYGQLLLSILPLLPTLPRLGKWYELVEQVMNEIDFFQDTELQSRLLNRITSFHLCCGDMTRAKRTIDTAQQFIRELEPGLVHVETLSIILWMQALIRVPGIDMSNLSNLLTFEITNQPVELRMRLLGGAGAACNEWSEYESAVFYAGQAYAYWASRAPHNGLAAINAGRTARVLSSAYRRLHEPILAARYLELAADYYARTDYIWQHSQIAFEMGVQYFTQENYDHAIQWLQQALDDALKMDDEMRLSRIYHAMGQTQTMRRDHIQIGHDYLQRALRIVEQLDMPIEMAHIRNSLAWNAARNQDYATAEQEIRYGRLLCQKVLPENRREELLGLFDYLQTLIDERSPVLTM